MHSRFLLLIASLLPACAAPARFVDPLDDRQVEVRQVVDRIAAADVVFLGEIHDNAGVHRTHLDIIERLFQQRPFMAISLEMFERDVQTVLWQYLLGYITEGEFLRDSRPWPHYQTDYRPLVEWAKANSIPVLASNVPRSLAAQVAREGLAAAAGHQHAAREVSAPDDTYWTAFKAEMEGHMGADGEAKMRRLYEAQCLKDDTMAEAIVDFLREERRDGRSTMVVHVCGRFHSDRRLGTVARVESREPGLRIQVLSAEAVPEGTEESYIARPGLADMVLVVSERLGRSHAQETAAAKDAEKVSAASADGKLPPQHPPVAKADPDAAAQTAEAEAAQVLEGGRPGLGLMPDYDAEAGGLRVAMVVEGGPAAKAGVQDGDLIVKLAGEAVADIDEYMAVLSALKIGEKVDVIVRRGGAEQGLQVVVGSRSR